MEIIKRIIKAIKQAFVWYVWPEPRDYRQRYTIPADQGKTNELDDLMRDIHIAVQRKYDEDAEEGRRVRAISNVEGYFKDISQLMNEVSASFPKQIKPKRKPAAKRMNPVKKARVKKATRKAKSVK